MNSINKTIFIFLFSIISLLALNTCKEKPNEPPIVNEPIMTLELEDAHCTEVWLQLKTKDLELPTQLTLKQFNPTGDSTSQIFVLNIKDSLLYIDSLLPKKRYRFKAEAIINNKLYATNQLAVQTMDTTSHNFTWQTFTFGESGNSALFDVAIINENNIWAVGQIYMRDSLGNHDPKAYNAVHWDGSEWKLKRIYTYSACNAVDYSPLKAIWAFSDSNIVVTNGGSIGWFNGKTNKEDCSIRPLLTGSINKMWGTSSSNLYAVGNNGNIAHWNGRRWRKIESGTDVDLLDVWGTPDGKVVWTCGENIYKTVLVKIENNKANIVFERTYPMAIIKNKFSGGLLSIWTNTNNLIYVLTPYNLYRCKVTTRGEGEELYPYNDYFKGAYLRLRGTAINNLFTSGNKSTITHFNGISWEIYDELRNEDHLLRGLDVSENIMVTVGEKYENIFYYKAMIIVGKK